MAINKDEMKNKLAGAWSKTVDFSKKTAADIQKGAKDLSDKTKEEMYAYRMKKYNPLYKEEHDSDSFRYPSVIRIAQDNENADVDVCENAIGWRDSLDGVQVFNVYQKHAGEIKVNFIPVAKLNDVYCVDPFDATKYVSYNDVFIKSTDEKLAELENIAYCLGAKKCSIEIIETNSSDNSQSYRANAGAGKSGIEANQSSRSLNGNNSGGATVSTFAGHDNPTRPSLKWFAHNDSVNKLIDMRCYDPSSVQSKKLELKGSTLVSMSKSMAMAIDKIAKVSAAVSMERQSTKEHNSVLIFEVEF